MFDASGNCQSGVWGKQTSTQHLSSYFFSPGGGRPWAEGSVGCPSDMKILGGGAHCISGAAARLSYSNPVGDWGWYASCDTGQWGQETDVKVFAICMIR